MIRNIKYSLIQLKNDKMNFFLKILQMVFSLLILGLIISGFENNYQIIKKINHIRAGKEAFILWDSSSEDYRDTLYHTPGNDIKTRKVIDELLNADTEFIVFNNVLSNTIQGKQVEIIQVTPNFFDRYSIRGDFDMELVEKQFHIHTVENYDYSQNKNIAIVGSDYKKKYKIGDTIRDDYNSSSYEIIGFLDSNQSYIRPSEGKELNSLDNAIIMPVFIDLKSVDDMLLFLLSCQFLVDDISELDSIMKIINEDKVMDTYLRSYTTQLEFMSKEYSNEFLIESILGGSLLLFAFLGMLCTMIQRIVDNAYEYAVNLLCGARIWDIYARIMFEFVMIIMTGVLVSVWVYGFNLASYVIVLIALICFALVSVFAIKKIDFGSLVENIRSRG